MLSQAMTLPVQQCHTTAKTQVPIGGPLAGPEPQKPPHCCPPRIENLEQHCRGQILITAGGENVPPLPIEDAVKKELPLLSNAMLIGDGRKFLSMLLTLKCVVDLDTSEPTDCLTQEACGFCEKVGSNSTKVSEIVKEQDSAVYRAIQEGIDRVNARAVANVQRIQKWAVLEKDFSIAGGEFGPTMKLRRQAVMEKYRDQIEAFYKE